jgi:DNA-directed RNA polymerase subunit RPC12/RpoP
MNNFNKTFKEKFPHIEGMRCPRCDLPVVDTPYTTIVYACAGCERSFVHEEETMIENPNCSQDIVKYPCHSTWSFQFRANIINGKMTYDMLHESKFSELLKR